MPIILGIGCGLVHRPTYTPEHRRGDLRRRLHTARRTVIKGPSHNKGEANRGSSQTQRGSEEEKFESLLLRMGRPAFTNRRKARSVLHGITVQIRGYGTEGWILKR